MQDQRWPDLQSMFCPRSVAFVASPSYASQRSARILATLKNFEYPGEIYQVNFEEGPNRNAFTSIESLPATPDHVGVLVRAEAVLPVLRQCAARKVPFVTVYSDGFAESGTEDGGKLQDELVALSRSSGTRIMGPNCNGLVSFGDRFAMTASSGLRGDYRTAGDVGVVSQSGGVGQINVMWRAQEAGLDISYQASCGNEADLDTFDFVKFMLDSERTNVVLLAIESIKDAAKLRAVAQHAARLEKPIIVLKYGRSEIGGRVAASHSGAISGSDDICDAAFRQFGLIRVADCDELYSMAVLLRQRRWPAGKRAASVSATGGNAAHVADIGEDLGIEWTEYASSTQVVLADLMQTKPPISNPTDMNALAKGEPEPFYRALSAIEGDPNVDLLSPIFVSEARDRMELAAQFVRNASKPAALLWVGGCTDDVSFGAKDLVRANTAVYRDAIPCFRAMRAAIDFGQYSKDHNTEVTVPIRPSGVELHEAREKLQASRSLTLGEKESKAVLACYGFPVTVEWLAKTSTEAAELAGSFGGAVALKVVSPDIAHKTEAGGVRLGIRGDNAVKAAFDEIVDTVRSHDPEATIDGVLIQEMVPAGVELILGVVRDPVFGPIIVVGLGGIFVEVLRDVSFRVAPVSARDASAMLQELRCKKILEGVRGMGASDTEAIVDLIVRLSWLAVDFEEDIAELDINPLIVFEKGRGCRVVDALIVRTADDVASIERRLV